MFDVGTRDALLAVGHHLSVFVFTAFLAIEVALLRVRLGAPGLRFLSRIDGSLGILTFVIAFVGVARVIWGAVPADYYLENWLFWTKMGFLSVLSFFTFVPGIRIQRWHKAAAADPAYEVSTSDLTYVRRALWVEVALLIPVPIAAALMARGYGVF
jgi:putative membrane protein